VFQDAARLLAGAPEAVSWSLGINLLKPARSRAAALDRFLKGRRRPGESEPRLETAWLDTQAAWAFWSDGVNSAVSWIVELGGRLVLVDYGENSALDDQELLGRASDVLRLLRRPERVG